MQTTPGTDDWASPYPHHIHRPAGCVTRMFNPLHMDFKQRLVIEADQHEWIASPAQGVERIPLEREAAESGHVTSLVRYLPGAHFNRHPHPLGEEIFVLEGVLSDQQGDYPAGTYLRNPPGSEHAPFSEQGCLLFVKLNQFDRHDSARVNINTRQAPWLPGPGSTQVIPLHNFEHQHTALVRCASDDPRHPHRHFGGEEILIISGCLQDEFGRYPPLTWLRSPHMSQHTPSAKEETVFLLKTGHLPLPL